MAKLGLGLMAVIAVAVIMAAVGCAREGPPSPRVPSAHESGLETAIDLVSTAVGAYFALSGTAPTEDGRLPPGGAYSPIDFNASFTQRGSTFTLYPDFIITLPRHHDEGVWRIDSNMRVSVDMDPLEY